MTGRTEGYFSTVLLADQHHAALGTATVGEGQLDRGRVLHAGVLSSPPAMNGRVFTQSRVCEDIVREEKRLLGGIRPLGDGPFELSRAKRSVVLGQRQRRRIFQSLA